MTFLSNNSGLVSLPFIRDMQRLRCLGVIMSIIWLHLNYITVVYFIISVIDFKENYFFILFYLFLQDLMICLVWLIWATWVPSVYRANHWRGIMEYENQGFSFENRDI